MDIKKNSTLEHKSPPFSRMLIVSTGASWEFTKIVLRGQEVRKLFFGTHIYHSDRKHALPPRSLHRRPDSPGRRKRTVAHLVSHPGRSWHSPGLVPARRQSVRSSWRREYSAPCTTWGRNTGVACGILMIWKCEVWFRRVLASPEVHCWWSVKVISCNGIKLYI